MFFSATILASVGFLATLAHGNPASLLSRAEDVGFEVFLDESGAVESFENAARLGVDIFGPIPSDARRVDDHWEADPGTKALAWIRAQADIDWDALPQEKRDEIEKRQGSGAANINLSVWTGDNCKGGVVYWDNVSYNVNYWNNNNLYSIGISLRSIRDNEHLDLSRLKNGDACGQFVLRVGSGQGCLTTNVYNCFRLWVE
ncbi:hypothetical protein EDB81DRAFT_932378 [Dactylonectria macrodidyma]|uniref:Uncharacterized protein n=1 Tax=Dactylonectria macrodidyma TaxID=307937 RepID=A0A9P9JCE0_9HYPO|nr:hypothetical protein BKA56DRAFT_503876 [Ilyonectria sp. MPI-CAGE-AT-0026]KAH7153674.1 hypothetical protein EDB81DRAFT_932378 [Dactylonectria macrodidyma]